MIQPEPRLPMGIGNDDRNNIHVDQDDAKGPDVGRSRPVCRGTVVPTLKAHVRSTSTVHVGALCLGSRKAKICQLDDDTTLAIDETVCDDKVLWLDVAVKDAVLVTGGNSITHLGKHASDESQPGRAEELRRVEGREKGRRRGGPRGGGWDIFRGDGSRVVMVTCLLKEVEQVLAGYIL